jgi:arginine transport system substrate-binding protein
MKKILALVALLFITGCKSCQNNNKNQPVLRVGTNANFPPFESIDEKGELIGFDIDVARAIGNKLGKKVEFKEFDFDGLILALNKEQIDLILSGMSITESRKKEITMVPYQGEPLTEIAFLFWQKAPNVTSFEAIKDLAKEKNLMVTVQSGHYLEEFLRSVEIPTKALAGPPEQVLDIKYGKSLAVVVDTTVAKKLAQDHAELKHVILPLPKEKWDLGNGIGIKKTRADLVKEIEEVVKKMSEDGSLKELKEKWFKAGL